MYHTEPLTLASAPERRPQLCPQHGVGGRCVLHYLIITSSVHCTNWGGQSIGQPEAALRRPGLHTRHGLSAFSSAVDDVGLVGHSCMWPPLPLVSLPLADVQSRAPGGCRRALRSAASEQWLHTVTAAVDADADAHGAMRVQSKLDAATAAGKRVRGLVFINPGNPTGQCLTRKSLEELIEFAVKNEVVLMADEVYQPNIYQDEKPFYSARCARPLPPAAVLLSLAPAWHATARRAHAVEWST